MSLQVLTVAGRSRLSDVVKMEASLDYSREQVNLLAGSGAVRPVAIGQVLGRIAVGTITAAADGGNTGNGAVTGLVAGPDVKAGVYTLLCVEDATDAGRFEVSDPDGNKLEDAYVGVAYATAQIGFTIGDGATDFAAGDTFALTVPAGSGKVVPLSLAATDGSQRAYAVAVTHDEAPDGVDKKIPVLVRHAIVNADGLVWPSGASADQKAAALAELAEAGVIARSGY